MSTIKYDLHTRLDGHGKVTIHGRELGGSIIFDHPDPDGKEGPIVLQITVARANEIASLHRHVQNRMNLRIERTEIYTGRDFHREPHNIVQCPYCYADVTWVDKDFMIHSIPWCRSWREKDGK